MTVGRGVTRVEIVATCGNCRSARLDWRTINECRKTGLRWGVGDPPVCKHWMPCKSMMEARLAKDNGTQWEWSPNAEREVRT